MPADDIAISVRNLTKTYRLFAHPGDRIKQAMTFGLHRYHKEFTALKDLSFDIKKGETVGIIGRNGSGKSTLLQLICGILKPTSGTVVVNGRVSALLELGAGFNPEFTGRENVYFQGALMGITEAEMRFRFRAIADFADIGEFIDQPVRTYSSGMFVRLAFAVAVHVNPEVLIVDEALGVGDAEFQERSFSRMKSMRDDGTTILFVTHSIPIVRNFCQRALWLDSGSICQAGDAAVVSRAYLEEVGHRQSSEARHSSVVGASRRHASGREKTVAIVRAMIDNSTVPVGTELTLRFELQFSHAWSPEMEFGLGVVVRNEAGRIVSVFNTLRDDIVLGGTVRELELHLPRIGFVPGRYWVTANVCDRNALFPFDELDSDLFFEVPHEMSRQGLPRWEGELACEHNWRW